MAKIQLVQRTQVGPRTGGVAKPPLSLADRSGQIALGQSIEQVGSDIDRKLVTSRAANEQAVFRGVTETELQGYDTFVKTNPNASLEQLKKEQEAMMARIRVASSESTTGIAKRGNTNWLAANESLLNKKAHDQMVAVKTRQELDTYAINQKLNMDNFDKGAYFELKEDMVAAGLLNRDVADAQEEMDFGIMDKAQSKVIVSEAARLGVDAWQTTVTKEAPEGDLRVAFATIEELPLTEKEKKDAEAEAKTRVINRRAENKITLENAQETDRTNINQLVYFDKDYDAANEAIKASSLTEKEKSSMFADSERRALAKAKGVPIITDRVAESTGYNMSLGIWRGDVSKKDMDKWLLDNSASLDDSAYQRISSSAANTLKSSQAEALSRANTEAGQVLVDRVSDSAQSQFLADAVKGLSPDIADLFISKANEERQLQFWSLSRYNAELRQWIEDNPDKLGKEFFQFSESLKHDYWNRSIEDLEELRAGRETDIDTEAKFDKSVTDTLAELQGKIDKQPVVIESRDDYDKLPSGTLYVDSQGRIAEKR